MEKGKGKVNYLVLCESSERACLNMRRSGYCVPAQIHTNFVSSQEKINSGNFEIDSGTARSISLFLQCLMPALMHAPGTVNNPVLKKNHFFSYTILGVSFSSGLSAFGFPKKPI
jgi:hypothetical protein